MLKFSKINILTTALLSILVIFFTLSNFTTFDDEYLNKKINLGLDLQGGSYLLLKIDNDPVVIKELQNKAISIKAFFKDKKINIFNIKVTDEKKITFSINQKDREKVLNDLKEGKIDIIIIFLKQTHTSLFTIFFRSKVNASSILKITFSLSKAHQTSLSPIFNNLGFCIQSQITRSSSQ